LGPPGGIRPKRAGTKGRVRGEKGEREDRSCFYVTNKVKWQACTRRQETSKKRTLLGGWVQENSFLTGFWGQATNHTGNSCLDTLANWLGAAAPLRRSQSREMARGSGGNSFRRTLVCKPSSRSGRRPGQGILKKKRRYSGGKTGVKRLGVGNSPEIQTKLWDCARSGAGGGKRFYKCTTGSCPPNTGKKQK